MSPADTEKCAIAPCPSCLHAAHVGYCPDGRDFSAATGPRESCGCFVAEPEEALTPQPPGLHDVRATLLLAHEELDRALKYEADEPASNALRLEAIVHVGVHVADARRLLGGDVDDVKARALGLKLELESLETEAVCLARDFMALGQELLHLLTNEVQAARAQGPTEAFKEDMRFVLASAAAVRAIADGALEQRREQP